MCGGGGMNETLNKIDPVGGYIAQRDPVGNMLEDAYQAGNWGEPYGQQKSGWDVLGAGLTGKAGITGSADEPRDRAYGRAFGTAAATYGAATGIGAAAGGTGTAAGAEGGAAGEGAAGGGAGLGSGLSSSSSSGSGIEEMGGAQGLQSGAASGSAEMGGAQGLVAPAGTEFAGGATTSAVGAGGAILSAQQASPTFNLSPETANALGISGSSGGGLNTGTAGTDTAPSSELVSEPPGSETDPSKANAAKKNTIMGLKPQTAALLGLSGIQAISKPKTSSADRSLETNSTPAAQQASAVISSGGTGTPAWATQKDSIDSDIERQIQEQSQAIVQQAVNAGQGADSMVVKQQVNQLKEKLEAQRQTLYAQQQQKNVQAALTELGISNQALSNVSANQYNNSQQAKQQASQTASLALLLQALG